MPQAVPDSEPPEHYDPRSNKFSPSVDGTGTWPTPISAEKISADKGFPSPASFGGNAPPAEQSTSRKTTIWGLRRRTFWIVLAVVVLVVIVALVGGLAGGLRSRNSDSDSASPPSPSPTGPLDPQQRAVGSASSGGSDGGALQLFYQDIDTTDILYRLSWGDSFGAEQRVDLTDVPNWGTPLATTTFARPGNQGLDVNLFYLSTNETNNITIVRTTLNCPQAAASCNTTSSEIISTTFRNGVHPSSGLTAILLNNSQDRFRVFFRATRGVVWSLVGDQPIENGWSFHQVGGPAPEGSSISASLRKGLDQIFVAFVLDDTGLLRSAEYNDSVGVKGATNVDGTPGSGFSPTARFAACYEEVADVYHVYYVARVTGEIIGYYRRGPDGDWQTNRAPEWGVSDGDITASSWNDQVRIMYMNKGRLAMNRMDNGTWSGIEYL